MDDGLKQRLIGALVLIALALVFLPTLFYRDQRIPVDQISQVPAKPVFEPVVIEPPQRPNVAPYKPIEKVFQPPIETVVETPEQEAKPLAVEVKPEIKPEAKKTIPPTSEPVAKPVVKPEIVERPSLSSEGVAKSWVLQVASFKDQKRAQVFTQTLIDKGYRAFVRTSTIASGKVSRTFVGPHIDKKSALALKKQLDSEMKINSLVIEFAP